MLFVILSIFLLSAFIQKFLFFSCFCFLSVLTYFFYILWLFFIFHSLPLTHEYTHEWAHAQIDACGREWEGVSTILRSVGFDLFHLLLSHINRRPAGWNREGGRDREKKRHHGLDAVFRCFITVTGIHIQSYTDSDIPKKNKSPQMLTLSYKNYKNLLTCYSTFSWISG